MKRILVIDDDEISLAIVKKVLSETGFEVETFESSVEAWEQYEPEGYDLILSDYFMPDMNGDELLKKVRKHDDVTPFVFLTSNTDVKIAIELVKSGADDHIVKPIVAEELVFRVNKNLKERENLRMIEEAEKEKALLDLEHQKLVNWRALYASKDITQTEQMIALLSRTINQSGGFLWLELLKSDLKELDDKSFRISKDLVDMILSSAEGQKSIFDYITFISQLDDLVLHPKEYEIGRFVKDMNGVLKAEAGKLAGKYPRDIVVSPPSRHLPTGKVAVDPEYFPRILRELLINAVKYSPEDSRILTTFELNTTEKGSNLDFTIRNKPKDISAKARDGSPIRGIPYDYSELVFDLFYTIESFPVYLEEEEWSDGTGLYVARKLLRNQNSWIKAVNGVDYTGSAPESFVRITITIPFTTS